MMKAARVVSKTGVKVRSGRLSPLERGNRYDEEEDERLLRFILERKALPRVKGRAFWQEAESSCASGHTRSWQSLKNRFFKNIVPSIDSFAFVSESTRRLIARLPV